MHRVTIFIKCNKRGSFSTLMIFM